MYLEIIRKLAVCRYYFRQRPWILNDEYFYLKGELKEVPCAGKRCTKLHVYEPDNILSNKVVYIFSDGFIHIKVFPTYRTRIRAYILFQRDS